MHFLTRYEDCEAMFETLYDYYCDDCVGAFELQQLDADGATHTTVRRPVRNRSVCEYKSTYANQPKP